MATIIRVLAVDMQPIFCAGIRAVLATTADLQLVGETHRLHKLDTWSLNNTPDVILLAADMVTNSLLEAISAWKQRFVGSKLLVFLPDTHEVYLQQLIIRGADGCLLRSDPPSKLIQAIRTISCGGHWVSDPLWPEVIQSEAIPVPFTEIEKSLMPLLITEMTIVEIAHVLHMSDRTITRHIEAICEKLGAEKRLGAAIQIVRLGLA